MITLDEAEAAGGYSIIYADVPWQYTQGGRGSARNHYREMPLDLVRALPVSRLASKDAVLFAWATWPKLAEAQLVIESWGFEYKTCGFVWVKRHEVSGKACVGGGWWTRANTEFCLVGVRGNYPRRVDASVRQLVEEHDTEVLDAPRGRHSAKPHAVRDRIAQLMGDLPRIELFARDRADGWDAWGDDPAIGEPDVDLLGDRGPRACEGGCE